MPSVFKYNGNEIIDSSGNITASSVKNALNASGDAQFMRVEHGLILMELKTHLVQVQQQTQTG